MLDALRCHPVDRPPLWMMRQAGRALPEYRSLKERYSFLDLVRTPELAAEVTLQPIRRFGFDAAILFSDILVVPEALGQGYRFRDRGGIEMDFQLNDPGDLSLLSPGRVREKLDYVARAIPLIKAELGSTTALLGFAGSPWTLASFMIEGGSGKEHTRARQLYYACPAFFHDLMGMLTDAVAEFLQMQIDAGVDAVQIFDSLGGVLPAGAYGAASARWIEEIIARLGGQVPVIVFAKGVHGNWSALRRTGAQAFGIDWTLPLPEVRKHLPPGVAVQGNLDPALLETTPGVAAAETGRLLESMRGTHGFIFNLGHGVPPGSKLECLEAVVHTVKDWQ